MTCRQWRGGGVLWLTRKSHTGQYLRATGMPLTRTSCAGGRIFRIPSLGKRTVPGLVHDVKAIRADVTTTNTAAITCMQTGVHVLPAPSEKGLACRLEAWSQYPGERGRLVDKERRDQAEEAS